MRTDIMDKVTADLLSVPPLIFREVRRSLHRTQAGIKPDISPLHFEIMGLLRNEGTLYAAEIGERLCIARAHMTSLVDRLVELGFVERQMDSSDRRVTNLVLTDKGKTVLEEHRSKMRNAVKETLTCLSDEELKSLSDSLRNIRDILSKLQQDRSLSN